MPTNRRHVLAGAGLAGAAALVGGGIGVGVDRLLLGQTLAPPERSAAPESGSSSTPGARDKWRDISSGWTIPDEAYADQPYIVKADDRAWVCVLTTSGGGEGATSEHVVVIRSSDFGHTWSPLIAIEPPGPPESAYATLLKTPFGRIYAFYNYNKDNLREVKRIDGTMDKRVDTLGAFVFKYSDDNGRSWSTARYEIPVRETDIDRRNIYGGKVRFFWQVGRPLIDRDAVYVTLHKVGNFGGDEFIAESEGNFLRSDNILAERDPAKIRWETLPDGDIGLRAPVGPIAEEQSIVALSDGSLFTVYRTATDNPAQAYSRDQGHTWTQPEFMTYGPGARKVKNTRAANFVWNAGNGRYLYWFHNHGGNTVRSQRNPAWLAAGHEIDSPTGKVIAWSEPEILLYDVNPSVRMSYPDFVADNGRYFFTETQKSIARVHEVPAEFLEMLWNQHTARTVTQNGLIVDGGDDIVREPRTLPISLLPDLGSGTKEQESRGFTLDFLLNLESLDFGQVIVDNRDENGDGLAVSTTDRGTLQLSIRGALGPWFEGPSRVVRDFGLAEVSWDCDPGVLQPGVWHHVGIIVDGGPKIISFVVDGKFNDGGDRRQFGWARFARELRTFDAAPTLRLAPRMRGELRQFRMYDRALRTSEVVANWRASTS
ncbi:hypothetical protein [Mycobacterium sp. SA01]|uniref:hypothetical protein n=1 Tax=Mycobacterium sp. SA01 TaxID=3238820 RepID=UPI00351B8F83